MEPEILLTVDSVEVVYAPKENPLSAPVIPPPGSFFKLAPNVTLIDLKKIKHKQDLNKPFRIEEVTVMIDDKDAVKVTFF